MTQLPTISRDAALKLGLKKYFTGKMCRAGHVSERYVCSWACIECADRNAKQWINLHPGKSVEVQKRFRQRKIAEHPAWYATQLRAYASRNPMRHRLSRMWTTALRHAKREAVELDFSANDIKELLDRELYNGTVVLEINSIRTASLDKIDPSKPIALCNIRVVPLWYNLAKLDFSEDELISAMAEYGFARR